MRKKAISAPSCKASIFEASWAKGLSPVSSYPAAILAVGFFCVTCFVLFKDVADGAPITTDHVMSLAVLVGTFASGHLIWPQLQQWRLLPALGLALLFLTGTFYCVTASGGRNAATTGAKAELVHKSNEDRQRLEDDLRTAKERLSDAQGDEARECATGEGAHCKGWRATVQERETYANVLEAQLRLMKPEAAENPELHHAAKVFASLSPVPEDRIFDLLVLWFPFAKAVFAEVACLVFGGIGFSQRRVGTVPPTIETVPALKPKQETVPTRPFRNVVPFRSRETRPFRQEEALGDLLSLGSVPSQEALTERWHRSKATVSRWLARWERDGQITKTRVGRCNLVS